MTKKIALIFGGLGQNGYLLTKFLIKKKYKIYSIIKSNIKSRKIVKVKYLKININHYDKIFNLLNKIKPDEIYNFIGPSDKISFEQKSFNFFKKDFILNLYTLEAIRLLNLNTKFFYCSSSEVFGSLRRTVSEKSKRIIENNYSLTKNMSELLIEFYRYNFNINACFGILFNHDSIYRKKKFLYKILLEILQKKNIPKPILIKNINDIKYRSDAEKIVKVIWKILQRKKQDDYVISTSKSISVKNLIKQISNNYKINLIWKKKSNKIEVYKNSKLLITAMNKQNQYRIKPNLNKIESDLKINTKNLSLF